MRLKSQAATQHKVKCQLRLIRYTATTKFKERLNYVGRSTREINNGEPKRQRPFRVIFSGGLESTAWVCLGCLFQLNTWQVKVERQVSKFVDTHSDKKTPYARSLFKFVHASSLWLDMDAGPCSSPGQCQRPAARLPDLPRPRRYEPSAWRRRSSSGPRWV